MIPVNHFNKADTAFEVSAEIREPGTVLPVWPGANAIGQMLAHSLAHAASLAVIDVEPFFERNGGSVGRARGRAVLIAGDEAVTTRVLEDPRLGWRDFSRSFEVHHVHGTHGTLLAEPHAPAIAGVLTEILRKYRQDQDPGSWTTAVLSTAEPPRFRWPGRRR